MHRTRRFNMLIAQLSDLHVTVPGATPGAGVDAAANLARAVAQIERMDPRPDLVVLSGDLTESGADAEYVRLAALLGPLSAPYCLMAGNHDDREALRRAFPGQPRLDGAEGYLQYAIDVGELRLLLLDSLQPGTPAGGLCGRRLAWLDTELAAAPDRPTIVFVHHPPFETGLPQFDRSRLLDGDALGAIIQRYDCVLLVACGHLHRAIHGRWHGTTVSVCPSTAHQFALDLSASETVLAVAEGPGFQLHRYHAGMLCSFTVPIA